MKIKTSITAAVAVAAIAAPAAVPDAERAAHVALVHGPKLQGTGVRSRSRPAARDHLRRLSPPTSGRAIDLGYCDAGAA